MTKHFAKLHISAAKLVAVSVMALGVAALTAGIVTPGTAVNTETLTEEEMQAIAVADSLARLDSIVTARTASFVDNVSASYKDLKFRQYDGILEAELYPKVLHLYTGVTEALTMPKIAEGDVNRCHGMLLDLAPLLTDGSMYYSSAGDMGKMTEYATAYVNLRLNPELADLNFAGSDRGIYPALLYCAASNAYNSENYLKAIDYIEAYLATPTEDRREQMCQYLGQACLIARKPERAIPLLVPAVELYPSNFDLLMITLQNCLEAGEIATLQPLLDKAILMRPDDMQLIATQARLLENEGNYKAALDLYDRLFELKPNSLTVAKHLALCYYNLGVEYHNKALMDSDEKTRKRNMRQADAYLNTAVTKLNLVIDNDPNDMKFLKALAMTYASLGQVENLEKINTRLQALGTQPIKLNSMPDAVTLAESKIKNPQGSRENAIPSYQDFAKDYIEKHLAEWSIRQEFEKSEDFKKRVSGENSMKEYESLKREAEAKYLEKYGARLRISDMNLGRYDVDHETYLITSDMGQIVLPVPYKNREAEAFKSSWDAIQIRNLKFFIQNDRPAIAAVDFISGGKTYSYNAQEALEYVSPDVFADPTAMIRSIIAQRASESGSTGLSADVREASPTVLRFKSDVDENIPVTSRKADNMIALIFANERYKNVTNVESALNDGEAFREYCLKTLGIPASQVIYYPDASLAEMKSGVTRVRQLVQTKSEAPDLVVYYAGHGFPDDATKDAYLLPVDGDGITLDAAYPLKKFYADLSGCGVGDAMVFLDACFSGSSRSGELNERTRGVALKANKAAPEGNMYVLSATSNQETAMPYAEKNHGLFTYYLLKKLQLSKGNVTLRELSDYVEQQVKSASVKVNSKLQTPSTSVSGRLRDEWTNKKLRP